MLYVDEQKYIDIRKKIINDILSYNIGLLKDPLVPKRDKLAVILLSISFKTYRFIWILFSKIKKGFY